MAARHQVAHTVSQVPVCERELERTDSGKVVSVSFLQCFPVAVFENELVLMLAYACSS